MQDSIRPFDIIILTQDTPAKATVRPYGQARENVNIVLPTDSILFSNTHNYLAVDEFSFIPNDSKQLDTIINLYFKRPMQKVLVIGYDIQSDNLRGKYKTKVKFDYASLQPDSIAHIYIFAYMFLDGKIEELSPTKLLCFVADTKSLEKTKTKFENNLITHKEALEIMVNEIKNQIGIRQL